MEADRNARKVLLQNWMKEGTQHVALENPGIPYSDIVKWWNLKLGIRMDKNMVIRDLHRKVEPGKF